MASAQYDNPALWSAQDPKDWVTGLACGRGRPVLEEGVITQIKIAGVADGIAEDAPAPEVGRLAQTAMEDQPADVGESSAFIFAVCASADCPVSRNNQAYEACQAE